MNLLVAVDFSDCTHGLVDRATELAAKLGAHMTLLHVIDAPSGVGQATVVGADGAKNTGDGLLFRESSDVLAKYAERAATPGLKVRTLTRKGAAGEVILGAARDLGASFIVVGTHGRRGVNRVMMGSIAEYVVRRADVPVITMRTQHRPECVARNCSVCSSHITDAQHRLQAELDG